MEYKIVRLNLNRGADLLGNPKTMGSLALLEEKDVSEWWKEVPEKFKEMVFKPASKVYNIQVTAFLISKLKDVTIYASNLDPDTKKFRSIYVIANKNVVEMKEISPAGPFDFKTDPNFIVDPVKPALITWLDAISNYTAGTPEEIMEKSKIDPVLFAGNIIGVANDALYAATAYNWEVNKYRGIIIIPLMNVVSIDLLE
jgi:hypothetical protein